METLEYKCPCCGGALSFNATLQKVKCPYCDSEFETETLKDYDVGWVEEESVWQEGGSQWSEEEKDKLAIYLCEACGGELVTEETTSSSFCPYCGNPVILKGRLAGGLRPDYLIPFKLDKEKVNDAFASFIKGKILLPKSFREECKTEEIKGLYVPFWIYDADVTGKVRFKGTKVRHWVEGNYECRETRYYSIVRGGQLSFDHIPADGSKKLPDELMESIEPYDFNEAVAFQSAYLSGFYSDKYDVTQEETVPRINERIRHGTEDELKKTIKYYDTLIVEKSNVHVDRSNVSYTLYPVWMMQKKWRDKTYTYAINGQTGKTAGELPSSMGKLFLLSMLALLIVGVLSFGFVYYLEETFSTALGFGVVAGMIACALTALFLLKQIKTVSKQHGATAYYRQGSLRLKENSDIYLYRNISRTYRPREQSSSNHSHHRS